MPLGTGRPLWVEDSTFRLDYHVRHTALPGPGGEAELMTLVNRVIGQRLDRTKPLWELWLVEGLENGRWAIISKTHHAMVDGVSGVDLMSVLFDLAPDVHNEVPPPWTPAPTPGAVGLLTGGVQELVRNVVGLSTKGIAMAVHPKEAVRSTLGGGRYHDAVEVAREHILAGDIFQVVLAQRFDLDDPVDPFDVYRVLRQVNPSPYMYVVRHPEVTLVGSSPEPMVQVLDGRVISRPIAGTRYRGQSDEHDRRLAAELSENPKERAEHVMLVDLARNDVGRVVRFGTEHVDELMTLERYSHVMHLTSQVSGQLTEGRTPVDVLRATFPAGTVSGAPKVRAMEIIDELEPVKRGPYAGVVGYVDFSGNLDTAIAIRTMVWGPDGHASVQAGAGIVADSDPADEDLECANKARALLTAAAAARRLTSVTLT
jgi:anthranilate/para-aminobenzoate synthase component I